MVVGKGTTVTGFEVHDKTFALTFEDPKYTGLRVRVGSVPVGQVIDLMQLAEAVGPTPDMSRYASEIHELFTGFGGALIEWNVTRQGQPVPATLAGVRSLPDMGMVLDMIMSWLEGMLSVSDPLVSTSSVGEPAPMPSIPMDVVYRNPVS